MRRARWLAFLFAIAVLYPPRPAAAQDRVGLVLLHGKLGSPMGESPARRRAIGGRLVYALKSAGYLVATPETCWSDRRQFDRVYADCLKEIDAVIAGLRQQGAVGIVVGGLSMGGNAAIAYGALHSDLLGVIALSPADDPVAKMRRMPAIAADVARARDLVTRGEGDKRDGFADFNTGPRGFIDMTVHTTPRIYLSFFAPDSLANIAANTAKLAMPLLWVAGSSDPSQGAAITDAFKQVPPHPLNRFATVSGGHLDVPDAAATAVLAWLEDLSAHGTVR